MLIGRTVLAEVARNFVASLTATTSVAFFMLSITFLKRTPGVGLGFLLDVFPLFFPLALQFTVPLAVLTANVLTFGRMAGDGELTALGASGISPWSTFRPALAGSAVVALAALLLSDASGPFASARLRAAKRDLPQQLQTSFRSGLCDLDLGPFRISFERFSGNRFEDVLLEWRKSADELQLWRARRGAVIMTDDDQAVLELEHAHSVFPYVTERGETHLTLSMAVRHPLDVLTGEQVRRRKRSALTAWQLAYVKDRAIPDGSGYRMDSADAADELARRTALAASAFLFALIGIPLGVLSGGGGRVAAFLLGIAPVLLVYFPLVITGSNLARAGDLPAYPALWSGNAVLAVGGVLLLRKVARR